MAHTWVKNYVKYDGHDVEPEHIFLLGSGETGKSRLWKVTYNTISKTLLCHCQDPEKLRVILLGPTGISAVNIGGTTIHSDLRIKLKTKFLGLSDKSNYASRNRLSEVKIFIIDELSMVSSDLWTGIDSSLGGIFMMIPEIAFAGLLVLTVADLFELPPVKGSLYFLNFLMRIV